MSAALAAAPDGCKSELSAYQYWASKQDGGFAPIDAWMGRAALAATAAQGDTWRDKCEALIEIWDDSVKPEDQRTYVSGAFPEMLEEIRAAIATKAVSK